MKSNRWLSLDTFDCIVLSGGGAKGAYAAGPSKALFSYYDLKQVSRKICLIGTSAGALSASILATDGPDKLIDFWLKVSNKAVLGVTIENTKFQTELVFTIVAPPGGDEPKGQTFSQRSSLVNSWG